MAHGNSAAKAAYIGGPRPIQARMYTLSEQEKEELIKLASQFDLIQHSQNPSVRRAWNDLALLLAFSKHDDHDSIVMETPHPHRSLREMVQLTMESLNRYDEAQRHITGLQYQIDAMRRALQDAGILQVERKEDQNCASGG